MGIGDGFTRQLLGDAGIAAGMRVLDVGCGPGDVTLMLAALVSPHGTVVGLDSAPAMLDIARSRVARAGLSNVELVQADLDHPLDIGAPFDAVVGRRVLMYLPNVAASLERLTMLLAPRGLMVFHEHDASMAPAGVEALPLHAEAQRWIRATIAAEGCDLAIGFHLDGLLRDTGLLVEELRAQAIVQTPAQPYPLGPLVGMMMPRIVAAGAATTDEINVDTLRQRLDEERMESRATYVTDMMFGIIARKPNEPPAYS